MVRRSGYPGVINPDRRFDELRPAVERLLVLERDHSRLTPAGAALDHAICAVRMAANLLTHQAEFYGASGPTDLENHVRTVAELGALRSALDSLRASCRGAFACAWSNYRRVRQSAGQRESVSPSASRVPQCE